MGAEEGDAEPRARSCGLGRISPALDKSARTSPRSGPLPLPNPELSGESTGKLRPGIVETVPRRLRAHQARTAPAVPFAVSIYSYWFKVGLVALFLMRRGLAETFPRSRVRAVDVGGISLDCLPNRFRHDTKGFGQWPVGIHYGSARSASSCRNGLFWICRECTETCT